MQWLVGGVFRQRSCVARARGRERRGHVEGAESGEGPEGREEQLGTEDDSALQIVIEIQSKSNETETKPVSLLCVVFLHKSVKLSLR